MSTLDIEIKELIISALGLEDISVSDIKTEAPLFGEGLGLDSIDALELGIAIKKSFGVTLSAEDESNKTYFYSVANLEKFISSNIK